MNTFSSLKTSIANWLNRDDLTSIIPDLISLAEARIYRDLRVKAMEVSLSDTIASGVIAVPSGYKSLKFAYIDGSSVERLQRKDPEWIYINYPTRASDSKPKFIAREVDNFIFGPYPDSGYTVKGVIYQSLEALSDTNTSNWFTTNEPGLLLFAALLEAEPYLKNDPRLVLWEKKYTEIKDRVQQESDMEEFSGSQLQVTAG